MRPTLAAVALPRTWPLDFPWEHPNGGLRAELLDMPVAYRAKVGDLPGRIARFYDRALESLDGAPLEDHRDLLDTRARLFLERRFHSYLSHRGDADDLPPYYYGYLQEGQGTPARRLIGFLPDRPPRAVMIDIRGYGHGLEHDLDRTEEFLKSGFAVFTLERAEHGLSSRLDPRISKLRNSEVFVEEADRAIRMVAEIRARDPRLSSSPLVALASSFGGAELVGVMHAAFSYWGIEAVVFDNPFWALGKRYPWWLQQGMRILFGAFSAFPEQASEMLFMYRLRSAPKRYTHMTDERYAAVSAYFRAFGPAAHPIAFATLDKLLDVNARWLRSDAAKRVLPPSLVLLTPDDPEVNPRASLDLFASLQRPGRDRFRLTLAHSPFVGSGDKDPRLVPDIVRFLLPEKAPTI